MNYYRILGVPENASVEDIKKAYRKLAKKYHPDVSRDSGDYFKLVTEAYQTLIDPKKRKIYDKQLENSDRITGYIESILKVVVTGEYKKLNRDIKVPLRLSLEEAFRGTEKKITFKRYQFCNSCNGTGIYRSSRLKKCYKCSGKGFYRKVGLKIPCVTCRGKGFTIENPCPECNGEGILKKIVRKVISVPSGVEEGDILLLEREGHQYDKNVKGNLLLKIKLKKHSFYTKKGLDLYTSFRISLSNIKTGEVLSIRDLNGDILTIKVPKDITTETYLRIKGRGFRNKSGKFGDLFIKIIPI